MDERADILIEPLERETMRSKPVSLRSRKSSYDYLTHIARPELRLFKRLWPAFQVCGFVGLSLAAVSSALLVIHNGLPQWVMLAIIASAIVTFLTLVLATKVITGEEKIIYYHHEIAVMLATGLLVRLLGQPVLPYLDVTILGIGLFLTFGRIGCFLVGCCHGKPNHWGVCYRDEHAAAGFAAYFVGVRLFPVQLVESAFVLFSVSVGIALVLKGEPPGTALAWYTVVYGVGRFCFEFLRGDPDRPYLLGFSQPQWVSILLMCALAWGELSGVLPLQLWHVYVAAGLALAMVVIALKRRLQRAESFRLLHPRHIREVADLLEQLLEPADQDTVHCDWTLLPRQDGETIRIGSTSLGVQISAGKIRGAEVDVNHYTISYLRGEMTEEAAQLLAQLILQLKRADRNAELLQGRPGLFHVLINTEAGRGLPVNHQTRPRIHEHHDGHAATRKPSSSTREPERPLLSAFLLPRQSQSPNREHNK
jgi:hypothetical protein